MELGVEATTRALNPAAYFGTEYSGFENNAYSNLEETANWKVDKVNRLVVGVNLGSSFGTSALTATLPKPKLHVLPKVHFMDLVLFSSKEKSILYDSENRKIWIVSELSLALQMAHIWAAHQSDRDALLSRMPYATPSLDSGSSAYQAVMESQETVLRDHSSGPTLFGELISRILEQLEVLREDLVLDKELGTALRRRRVLSGWELMDLALMNPMTRARQVRLGKETGKSFSLWTKEHPLALSFVGSNLEPHPHAIPDLSDPAVPIDLGAIRNVSPNSKRETAGTYSSTQSPDVSRRAVESQQATLTSTSQESKEPAAPISKSPALVKGSSDDIDAASLCSSSTASGRSSQVFSTVTGATSTTQLPMISAEPAIWKLRRLLLGEDNVVLIAAGVEQRGIGSFTRRIRVSLNTFGKDLEREATTKEQEQVGVFVRLKAPEVSEMIMERFDTEFQYKLDSEQASGKALPAGDALLQGLSVPAMAEEDDVESDWEPAAQQHDEELSSLENLEEYIRQSKAWVTFRDSLAKLTIEPSPRDKRTGEQPAAPHPERVALPIPDTKRKGSERQSEDPPKLDRPIKAVSPELKALEEHQRKLSPSAAESDDESDGGPASPLPPILRSSGPLVAALGPKELFIPPEPEPAVAPMLDTKEKVGPKQSQPVREDDGVLAQQPLPPIPSGYVQRLDDGHFRVKTRNRCNDVFEDTIPASTDEEARLFFRNVDRYDRLRGPIRKLGSRLLDLYWTFVPPTYPGPTTLANPEDGRQVLDAPEHRPPEPAASEPEPAGNAPATAQQEAEIPSGNDPGAAMQGLVDKENATAAPATVGNEAAAPGASAPNAGANHGGGTGPPPPQNDPHKVFICLPLGRPGKWRLRHAEFTGQANKPSDVTDEVLFNRVRTEIGKYQKSRGPLRFLFPVRVSKVEYYEFTLYHTITHAVSLEKDLAFPGKLPNEHPPPPADWRDRCPAAKWFFEAPDANDDLRVSLATSKLTDAVRHISEFAHNPSSTEYRKCVPWRLRDKLSAETGHPLGWGFVVRFEFSFFVFWCIWGSLTLLLSLALLFGLYVAPNGPAHNQLGVAVAVFLAPFGFLGTVFGGVYAYAKQTGYLDD